MKVLVTGFEPFGKFTINSSERAVSQLPKSLGGNEIVTAILPVSYSRSDKLLLDVMRSVRPDAVVCVGQNASAPDIRVESTAGNYAHSEEEDSDHNLWLYRSIDMSGAPSYRSTLPIEEIVRNLKQAGIDAEVSHSAGTFVCNCLMYQALRACETEFTGVRCGFVHVPALPEQSAESGQPGMPPETIVKALEIAIGTVIDPESDGVLAADEPDDDDEFGNIAGVTPAMLAALNDDDDDAEETGAAETAQAADGTASVTETVATAVQETVTAAAVETAAAAAVAYFAKTNRDKVIRDREQVLESEIYYGGPKKGTPSESKTGEVLKRISGSVPEKITTTSEAPRETLFEPPRERAIIDTKDYRVFSVDDKYRGAGDQMGQMTLTEFMDEFMPERQKTEQEIREEEKRTLIHEGDVRDPRTYQERKALREEAKRKEDAKEHIAFGDLYVMSETMRAMGKTLNKSVLVDDDIHQLLYTGVEDGGDICAYKIAELDSKGRVTARTIGELPTYAMAYEKYYVFRALTENKKIVCDPETYEISLEDI
ncbi:MAG: hypothetical protein J6Y67_08065 [Lachnospiraceae bacterium]|nr:hypothetical protein [Lachnospiraceae bacterium]